ncbi:sigma-70 family RNA polymerase sigma factor [Hymenobacter negativus]|uniref:Sigma-70 family RNA polymerase sigma factor n=1 Tax=Hymenobacter negativus TaxID=2795026 RepID=A0ABS0Q366_9BACT|nr:sigma-70 family RNA polymerase sigma factor [Hymenobacter negativus]MBH8557078.1 sigma-70 family RNA polymerase sigma factor [Hymenobacter negativus]
MLPPLALMPYSPLTDAEIISRVLAGEKQLFELLMRRYNQRMFRTGVALLGHPAAEEAMQNAWVKAYVQLGGFAGRASFPTWLTRIMLNECLMDRRRQQRFVDLNTPDDEPEPAAAAPTPLQTVLNDELREALEAAVQSLPDKYRSVFVLREVEGLSVAATAGALQLSEANVKVRLLRAREQLRTQLAGFAPQHTFAYLGARCTRMVRRVLARLSAMPLPLARN